MYLSQPRDLISSMTAGCSRSTKLWPPADHLTMMPYTRADQALNRATRTDSAVYSSPRSHQEYSHVSQGSSTTSLLYHYGQVDQVNMSIEYANSSSNLVPAMPQFNGHAKSRWFRSQHYQQEWDNLDPGDAETRPSHAYTELIKLCILKRREGKLTLNQLYRDLEEKFPFFAASSKGKGWKNTLRHNLSTQPYFIKLDREHGQLGKGHYWAYCPDLEKPTSLAQSSIVKLSDLWPSSVSSASLPPREESARNYCSATEFQPTPSEVFKANNSARTTLPKFKEYDLAPDLRELPNIYREPRTAFLSTDAAQLQRPVNSAVLSTRRLSSPVRDFGQALPKLDFSRSHSHSQPNPMRSRSATFSTISRPSIQSSLSPSTEWDRRRSSSFWPTSGPFSPTTTSSLSDADRDSGGGNKGDDLISRPALPELRRKQPSACKSLGDYYLSNPISTSRRKSSLVSSSSSSSSSSRSSPY